MRLARDNIDLASMGIEALKPRRARTGVLLLEISGGAAGADKANILAQRLLDLTANINDNDVVISRPEKMAELRLRDLEASLSSRDIYTRLAELGECSPVDIRLGSIAETPRGLSSLWVRCPLRAAVRIAKTPRVRIGWTAVRVELLPDRGVHCLWPLWTFSSCLTIICVVIL
ncbi:hypothetical protein ALC57_11023 [Trachymyrmex cornetzi]|uniref:Uncharacterized protein n=1 Tax=Trachymyrmex cornetzi TaxID=471704 RepID=A0A151J369_9HYME|nr:hypothetical protein ALC57_11023 [Trachymyrmex cornetzi]